MTLGGLEQGKVNIYHLVLHPQELTFACGAYSPSTASQPEADPDGLCWPPVRRGWAASGQALGKDRFTKVNAPLTQSSKAAFILIKKDRKFSECIARSRNGAKSPFLLVLSPLCHTSVSCPWSGSAGRFVCHLLCTSPLSCLIVSLPAVTLTSGDLIWEGSSFPSLLLICWGSRTSRGQDCFYCISIKSKLTVKEDLRDMCDEPEHGYLEFW